MKERDSMLSLAPCTSESVAKTTIQTDSGEKWALEYFLQIWRDGSEFFGLRVEKSTLEGVIVEREETPAITDSRQSAMDIAKAFAAGSVPPSVLLEMVDEWCSDFTGIPT